MAPPTLRIACPVMRLGAPGIRTATLAAAAAGLPWDVVPLKTVDTATRARQQQAQLDKHGADATDGDATHASSWLFPHSPHCHRAADLAIRVDSAAAGERLREDVASATWRHLWAPWPATPFPIHGASAFVHRLAHAHALAVAAGAGGPRDPAASDESSPDGHSNTDGDDAADIPAGRFVARDGTVVNGREYTENEVLRAQALREATASLLDALEGQSPARLSTAHGDLMGILRRVETGLRTSGATNVAGGANGTRAAALALSVGQAALLPTLWFLIDEAGMPTAALPTTKAFVHIALSHPVVREWRQRLKALAVSRNVTILPPPRDELADGHPRRQEPTLFADIHALLRAYNAHPMTALGHSSGHGASGGQAREVSGLPAGAVADPLRGRVRQGFDGRLGAVRAQLPWSQHSRGANPTG